MESRVNYTLVGIFGFVLLTLFVAVVFWLGKFGIKDDYDIYRVLATESVSGLNIEAPVKYRGVTVGSVLDIKINEHNTELIELVLKIKKNTPIKTNSIASLKPQGVTGLSFVDITPGDNRAPLLKTVSRDEVPIIPYGQSLFGKFDTGFAAMIDSLQSILKKTDSALNEKNMAQISSTLQNLQLASANLAARLDELGLLTAESEGIPAQTKEMIGKLSVAADRLNSVVATLDTKLKSGEFDYKKDVTKVTQESVKLITELRELTSESKALVRELNKNPQALLFGASDIPKGPGE